ncbi:hypothetical protein INT45_002309 [Circinella minor]|uniref:Uncharacterized protein n=1 Tax=Circinella minor TaxID=1195481 RepID=A0A8H7SC69_9FUNG|nr:hypothetical protein INT45_002309 [Circinella minor]
MTTYNGYLSDEPAQQWTGMVLVHGWPRDPQSQVLHTMIYYIGLVERGNATLFNKLGRWCAENNTEDWTAGFDIVVYNMNATIAEGINCSPYKAVYGQDPQISPLFSEYLRQAFPGQRVVNINDLPVDIRNSLFNDNPNYSDDIVPRVGGSIGASNCYTNNIQINTVTYNNSSNVQHTSKASSDYQSARDNNSGTNIPDSSSSSEVQRSCDSSSDGCDDSFYYGSESVERDTSSLYNANNDYDTDNGELNSDIYSQKSTNPNEERHQEYNSTDLLIKSNIPISKASSSSSSESEDMPLQGPDPNRRKKKHSQAITGSLIFTYNIPSS